MKSPISQKFNKLFVTAVFVGIQTVFLLLPSYILNAFIDVSDERIVGSLSAEYLINENKVRLNWAFEDKVINRNSLEGSIEKYKIFKINSEKEEFLYTIEAERETGEGSEFIWSKNLFPNQEYSFGVCKLSPEGVCSVYSNVQRIFTKKNIEIIYSGSNEIFIGDSIEIISNMEGHKISFFYPDPRQNYEIHLTHYKRIENSYFYEISKEKITVGNYDLIARVFSRDNRLVYEKKWPVKVNEQKIIEEEVQEKITEVENLDGDIEPTTTEDNLNEEIAEEEIITDSLVFDNWPEEISENENLFIKSTNKVDEITVSINNEAKIVLDRDSDTSFYINSNVLIENSSDGDMMTISATRDGVLVAENRRLFKLKATETNINENVQEETIEEEDKNQQEEAVNNTEVQINEQESIEKEENLATEIIEEEKRDALTGEQEANVLVDDEIVEEEIILDPRCEINEIEKEEECTEYLKTLATDNRCLNVGIELKEDCDKYLSYPASDRICIYNNFLFEEDCNDFLVQEIKNKAECLAINCEEKIEETIRKNQRSTSIKRIFESIREEKQALEERSIYREDIERVLSIPEKMIPIKNNRRFGVLDSLEKVKVDTDKEEVVQTSPVVLFFDTDGDGLPDDLEIRIGTNPRSVDTDGDSYTDLEEILNGYNPLGEGLLPDDLLSPIDWAIINRSFIEQPKISGEEEDNMFIENVVVLSSSFEENQKEEGVKISGKAPPETVVSIYLYSDIPVLFTTKTDKDGNFIYEIKDSISEGEHQVFIAINDDTGKIKTKSRAFSFFVGEEAQAITENSGINLNDLKITPESIETETKAIAYYLYLGLILTFISVIGFVLYFIKHKEQNVA